jgi:cysteine-rich repeat protein
VDSDCDSNGFCNELGACQCYKGYEPVEGSKGCATVCGDGIVMGSEECDPPGRGCSSECTVMEGWTCAREDEEDRWSPIICAAICGDKYLAEVIWHCRYFPKRVSTTGFH